MNKIIICLIVILPTLSGCSKKSDTPTTTNTSNDVTITGISGLYKGSTLTLVNYTNSISGITTTDPNFTFTLSYVVGDSCKIVIATTLNIPSKTYTLPLSYKLYNPTTGGFGSGGYNFSNAQLLLQISLILTPSGYSAKTLISYQSGNILFGGNGSR